jgi:hypothetical protein
MRREIGRSESLAAGVPDYVIDDERRWNYVLLHSYDQETGWNESSISKIQAIALLQLISSHYENRAGITLFGDLERRIEGK